MFPKRLIPGILKDDKTKKLLTAEQFVKRETTEWLDALGVFTKECVGAKKNEKIIVGSARNIGEMLANIHDFKRRR